MINVVCQSENCKRNVHLLFHTKHEVFRFEEVHLNEVCHVFICVLNSEWNSDTDSSLQKLACYLHQKAADTFCHVNILVQASTCLCGGYLWMEKLPTLGVWHYFRPCKRLFTALFRVQFPVHTAVCRHQPEAYFYGHMSSPVLTWPVIFIT